LEGGVLTLWSLARNPEFSTDYIAIVCEKKEQTFGFYGRRGGQDDLREEQ